MPPLDTLSKPAMSASRKVGLTVLRSYLAIAMILVVVKLVQVALATESAGIPPAVVGGELEVFQEG